MARTPEDRESLHELLERGRAARRNMQEVLDDIDARWSAEAERRDRRRRLLRRLIPFAR